jgi:ectoine hydroxylase-related dioxygenase (phytanoyl-CoA dioxygenase family)
VYWIPLTRITSKTSRVALIPGSHKNGLLKAKEHAFGHTIDEDEMNILQDFTAPLLDVGDVLIFSAFTVHKTLIPKNNSDLRFAVGIRHADTVAEEFVNEGMPRSYKIVMDMERSRTLKSNELSKIRF